MLLGPDSGVVLCAGPSGGGGGGAGGRTPSEACSVNSREEGAEWQRRHSVAGNLIQSGCVLKSLSS